MDSPGWGNRTKYTLIVVVALLGLACVIVLTVLLTQEQSKVSALLLAQEESLLAGEDEQTDQEASSVVESFRQWYGDEPIVVRLSNPEKIYAIQWTGDGSFHVSWFMDGVWAEVYRAGLDKE